MSELREAEDRPPHMIALVDMVETVTGTFGELPGEPIWRIEFDGYCADFDYSEAANNFANAINEACLVALLSAHPVEAEALEVGFSPDVITGSILKKFDQAGGLYSIMESANYRSRIRSMIWLGVYEAAQSLRTAPTTGAAG